MDRRDRVLRHILTLGLAEAVAWVSGRRLLVLTGSEFALLNDAADLIRIEAVARIEDGDGRVRRPADGSSDRMAFVALH